MHISDLICFYRIYFYTKAVIHGQLRLMETVIIENEEWKSHDAMEKLNKHIPLITATLSDRQALFTVATSNIPFLLTF